jgi:hypothetical protein
MTQGEELGLDKIDRFAPFVIHIIGIRPGKHPLFDEQFHGTPSLF